MRGPEALTFWENRWVSEIGKWYPGERTVLRGRDLLRDLGEEPWMRVFLYGITGRDFTDAQVTLFDRIWAIGTSYPDPRIWPNRIAALAGTARSTAALGGGAAVAGAEAQLYGGRTNIRVIDQWLRLNKRVEAGETLGDVVREELDRQRGLSGFGRPVAPVDERIEPMMKLANRLGLGDGPHTRLAFATEQWLQSHRYRMRLNISGLAAALSADQGITTQEYHIYATWCFSAGFAFAFIDAATQPAGAFFPMRCEHISYTGPSPRVWRRNDAVS